MQQVSRRHFFYSAGMALTAAQATRVMGANERVHVAIIGLGGRGRHHMSTYSRFPNAEIVALCDVNQAALERGQAQVEKATQQKPKGYRRHAATSSTTRTCDAVSMPLPNHWHALATIWACQAGKDVYVEKPACHNVFEGQRMIDAARKYNRMVQVGSQGRSTPHKIKAIAIAARGRHRQGLPGQGTLLQTAANRSATSPTSPTPPGRGLGQVPRARAHASPSTSCASSTTGTGSGTPATATSATRASTRWISRAGVWASRACRSRVVSTGGKYVYDDDQETPNTQIATFDYGDAELMFEVRGILTGNEGGIGGDRSGGNVIGNLFYGSDGWMALDGRGFQVYKGEKAEKTMDEKARRRRQAHFQNFLECGEEPGLPRS